MGEFDARFDPFVGDGALGLGLGQDETETALVVEGLPIRRDGHSGSMEGGEFYVSVENGGVE